ncbi:valine--tRNA ligase [Pseudoramibacter sp.]|jgi:valyl-tRNA synthetase|uniref:valine--tRNA ligase n=1 Tax=Pseudoramibacter sp. TaxID=2034862 RepID=UPI0025D2F2E5|nr:valine--tRNA ligase [Pseudoramibacter sp.]MCH4072991.1 valine--tRNA ligase [Pseudoramibacter sp.]MCH4106762.1 valine--tRNA ligase [Pseudoramibacter sp.]
MKKEMSKVYEPDEVENRIYAWWREKGYFKPEVHPNGKPYTIIMPPPNITGQLHMGHAFDDTLQDALIRYKRMQGYAALWVPGMDHASIATEVKVLNSIKEKENRSKSDLTREEFLKYAWDWAEFYRNRIRKQVTKLGASCDWDRERFTMDEGCSKAVKATFVRLYNKGLIYKGTRIINWCPDCQTALSDAEVEYEEEHGHLWHIRYPFADGTGEVVIATTRPETMLGDTGVAVNPDDERYKDIVGKEVILPLLNKKIPVVADDYVDMEFGTGVVKMTPAHDPNDYEVGKRHNLEEIKIMNNDGTMNDKCGKYTGMDRYECRKAILKDLEDQGYLVKTEDHVHNVGHCYRCHTTVETMTSEQWFVRMKELAKPAIDAVREGKTQFIPKRFSKIYFNWMENIRDWCISRQLWWGHQIPAWVCDECGKMIVSEDTPDTCPKCGSHHLKQEEDVLDTWFSSALWPFSTLGWPEQTEDLKKFYPNDVLVTGYDIIFFWVARMIFMGIDTMGEPPFSDVYIHGLIRDAQGRKMSKSLGNGIDPLEVIRDYSADAMRFAIITGNSAGNDIRWTKDKIESSRNFLNKIWNAARFVMMYMDDDVDLDLSQVTLEMADKWILSRMNQVIREVTLNIDKYELGIAAQKVYDFAWNEFCDWYIEFVKPRLNGDDSDSRHAALTVLNVVLQNILKLLHPFVPFITEEIYHYLPGSGEALIIAKWPVADKKFDFPKEEQSIRYLMGVIRTLRKIRKEANIPNKKKAALFVTTDNAENIEILNRSLDTLNKMGGVESIEKIDEDQIREDFVAAVVEDSTIYLALNDLVDKEKELKRLEREKAKIEKDLAKTSGKLNNQKFLENAPEAVVNKERMKDQENRDKLSQITARIDALKA